MPVGVKAGSVEGTDMGDCCGTAGEGDRMTDG